MADLLKGAPVTAALNERMAKDVEALKAKGVEPTLAMFRVGDRPDDIAYAAGAMKRCDAVGVAVKDVVLPADTDSETFFARLEELNRDDSVHGILMFRPLPAQIDGEKARRMLEPAKDVDGCTDGSLGGVFADSEVGFAPCTAQAVMEILKYYGIDCTGKKAVVVGRSLVVGRPVSMMLMHENATVTTCHTKTKNLASITSAGDIVVICAGKTENFGADYFSKGQIVLDVGIGWSKEKGKICGDVDFEEVEHIVGAITPVPGGVGTVTTSVLVSHVVEAAKRTSGE